MKMDSSCSLKLNQFGLVVSIALLALGMRSYVIGPAAADAAVGSVVAAAESPSGAAGQAQGGAGGADREQREGQRGGAGHRGHVGWTAVPGLILLLGCVMMRLAWRTDARRRGATGAGGEACDR
jgi:hypothetical protein